MTFENSRYFTSQHFEIKKSTLEVDIKSLFGSIEYAIPLEQIENKRNVRVMLNPGLLTSCLFCFVIGLLWIFAANKETAFIFFLLAATCFISASIFKKKVVIINTYDGLMIEMFFNSSNKEAVVSFADLVIQSSNHHLFCKYGKIDTALPIEPQINSIIFLRDREIISEDEYEKLKDQLLGRSKKVVMGFGI